MDFATSGGIEARTTAMGRQTLLPYSRGLLRCVRELAGEIEPVASAILETLPDWIGGRREKRTPGP